MAKPSAAITIHSFRRRHLHEQIAEKLSAGLLSGERHTLPGLRALALEFGTSRQTLRKAMEILRISGIVVKSDGAATHRPAPGLTTDRTIAQRRLKIGVITHVPLPLLTSEDKGDTMRILAETREAGHDCLVASLPAGKSSHRTGQLARLVGDIGADAWIVSGGSLDTLAWFAASGLPVLGLGGRSAELPIAATGIRTGDVIGDIVRRLAGLGHRRIVLITPESSRTPVASATVLAFRAALQETGVRPGEYHTPDWKQTPEGMAALMDSLFRVTPPTALICLHDDAAYGVLSYVTRHGMAVPKDVSLVAVRAENAAAWFVPGMRLAHVEEDSSAFFNYIRTWVAGVAAGAPPTRQVWVRARLEEGNTIGPAS